MENMENMEKKFVKKIKLSELSAMLKDLLNEYVKNDLLEMKQINNKVDPSIPDIEFALKNTFAMYDLLIKLCIKLDEKWNQDFKEFVSKEIEKQKS